MAQVLAILVLIAVAPISVLAASRGPTTACTTTTTAGNTNQATVAGITDVRAGCAVFYTGAYKYLGTSTFALGTATVTSAKFSTAPAKVELYAPDCITFYMYYPCSPTTATPAPTATVAATTAAPTTAKTATPTPTAVPTSTSTTTAAPKATSVPTTAAPTTTTAAVPATATPSSTPSSSSTSASTSVPSTAPSTAPVRATYSWGAANCLLGVTPAGAATYAAGCPYDTAADHQAAFFYRLRQPLRTYPPFNRVYLEIAATLLTENATAVRSLLASAHAQGVAVELLAGDDAWMASAAATATPIALCTAVATFNGARTTADEWLDGVHLDLEPQALAGWRANTSRGSDPYNDAYEANLLTILRGCRAALNSTGTTLAWDVAPYLVRWASDLWPPVLAERLVDYVAFMNYYTSLDAFVNGVNGTGGVRPLLASLAGSGIQGVFVADASDPTLAPPADSFWAVGAQPLESMLAATTALYDNGGVASPGFAGTGIHPLGDYIYLQPTGPPLAPACTSTGRAITLLPGGLPVASAAVYNAKSWAYFGYANVQASVPPSTGALNLTASKSATSGGYLLEIYDGPDLTRAAVDSIIYDVTCVVLG